MKTLVAYGTKYGTAKECAISIAEGLPGEAILVDLSKEQPDPAAFDKVILGGSVYVGQVRKEVKAYAEAHEAVLLKKPLGLFLVGMSKEKAQEEMAGAFSDVLRSHARSVVFLGGVFRFKKMNFMERALIKMVSKKDTKVQEAGFEADYDAVDGKAMQRLIQSMSEE